MLKKIKESFSEKTDLMSDSQAFKGKVSLAMCIVIFIIYCVAIPVRYSVKAFNLNQTLGMVAAFLILLVGMAWAYFRPEQIWGRLGIIASVFLVIIMAAYFNGGVTAPAIALLILFPILTSFLIGKRASLIVTLLSVGIMTSIFVLSIKNILPESLLGYGAEYHRSKLVVLIATLLFASGIAFFYEHLRMISYAEIKEMQDSHPSGIAKTNRHGLILFGNTQFEKILGYGHFKTNIIDLLKSKAKSELSIESFSDQSLEIYLNDGRWITILMKQSKTHTGHKIVFVNDVTIEKQNILLEKQLSEQSAIKSMVSTYNHEINNPLAIVYGYLSILKRQKSLNENQLEKVSEALNRVSTRMHMIRELIDNNEANKDYSMLNVS